MAQYSELQLEMTGEDSTPRKFFDGQVVKLKPSREYEDEWLQKAALASYFVTGEREALSGPIWDTETQEWEYHVTCLDGQWARNEAYVKEDMLISDIDTERKQSEMRKGFWKRLFG